MSPSRTVRIFISSPGDVAEERDKARAVVDSLQRLYVDVRLEALLWEELALPATASFQETIDLILARQPTDIAIFILWSRLGSPLGPASSGPNGERYRSGTEREFELMLAAHQASGGMRPLILAYRRDDDAAWRAQLASEPQDRLGELLKQYDATQDFVEERFRSAEGYNLRAITTYRTPPSFAQRLHAHLRSALDELLGAEHRITWTGAPFRGLAPFDVEHRHIFRGRDEETLDVIDRLHDQERAGCAFVAIVGASGAGKSSLARAGVAASLLQRSYRDDVSVWRFAAMTPGLIAGDPCFGLARSLAEGLPELAKGGSWLEDLATLLGREPELAVKLCIAPAVREAAASARGEIRLLLVLDQLEELWTVARFAEEDRTRFFKAVEAIARGGPVSVLATLRSDFYSNAQSQPAFLRLKGERGHFDLAAPDPASLRRLIVEPARASGLHFERHPVTGRSLDEAVLEDAANDAGALPSLEYALDELYRRRDESRRLLTYAAYETVGGVDGAVSLRAEEVFLDLPESVQAELERALPALVAIDALDERATARRRAPLASVATTPERKTLIDRLVAERLLTTDSVGEEAVVFLAHEALLKRWGRIAEWIESNRQLLRLRTRVERSEQMWKSAGRDPSLLLAGGLPLEEGRRLLNEARHLLEPSTIEYVELSDTAAQQAARRRRRLASATFATLAAFSLIAAAGAVVAWIQRDEALDRKTEAETERRRATNLAGVAEERRGEAETARNDAQTAAKAAEKAREAAEINEKRAREDRKIAEQKQAEAEFESQRAARQLDRSEALLYANQIAAAQREWERGDVAAAGAALFSTREDLRGWEFRYLRELFLGGTAIRPGLSGDAITRFASSSDGSRLVSAGWGYALSLRDATSFEPLGTFEGHRDYVMDFAVSDDSRRLVSGCYSGWIILWDVETQRELLRTGNQEPVLQVAFGAGDTILSSGPDPRVRRWNATDGTELPAYEGHAAEVQDLQKTADDVIVSSDAGGLVKFWKSDTLETLRTIQVDPGEASSLAVTNDGRKLVTAGDRGSLTLYSVDDATLIRRFGSHDGPIAALAVSADGDRILSGGEDQTVRLWDAGSGEDVARFFGHSEAVRRVAFLPNGDKAISSGRDGQLRVWELARRQEPPTFRVDAEFSGRIAISPDGARAAVTGDNALSIYDTESGTLIRALEGHEARPTCVAFSADGKKIVSGSGDSTAKVWNVDSGECLSTLRGHAKEIVDLSLSDEGILATASHDGVVRTWNLTDGEPLLTLEHPVTLHVAAISSDGRFIATGCSDGTLTLWDAKSGERLREMTGGVTSWTRLAFSPDGTRVLASASVISNSPFLNPLDALQSWDVATGRSTPLGPGPEEFSDLAVAGDGALFACCSGRAMHFFDAETGRPTMTLQHRTEEFMSVAIDAACRHVVGLTDQGVVHVWTAPAPEPAEESIAPFERSFISPTGDLIASLHRDESVRLWDGKDGRSVRTLTHPVGIEFVAISPNGRRVVAGKGRDRRETGYKTNKALRVWDVSSGERLFDLDHEGELTCLDYSPDGRWIVTAGSGFVRLWDSTTGDPVVAFQADEFGEPGFWSRTLGAEVSLDGRFVLSRGTEDGARTWIAETGAPLARISKEQRWGLRFDAETGNVVDAAGNEFDIETGRLLDAGSRVVENESSYSPDGRTASFSDDGTVKVFDRDGSLEWTFATGNEPPKQIEFSGDGKLLMTCGAGGEIAVWDLLRGERKLTIESIPPLLLFPEPILGEETIDLRFFERRSSADEPPAAADSPEIPPPDDASPPIIGASEERGIPLPADATPVPAPLPEPDPVPPAPPVPSDSRVPSIRRSHREVRRS